MWKEHNTSSSVLRQMLSTEDSDHKSTEERQSATEERDCVSQIQDSTAKR
jgi:hypothetical protein